MEEELKSLFTGVGLPEPRTTGYRLEGELESLLGRSFPLPGAATSKGWTQPVE